MLSALLVVCLAFVGAPRARAAPSPDERLFSLARLWGDVRYFDPWIAYRDVDWDAAALAAIPASRERIVERSIRRRGAGHARDAARSVHRRSALPGALGSSK